MENTEKKNNLPGIDSETYRCNQIRNTTIYVDRTDPNHSIIVSGSKAEIEAFVSQVHSTTPSGLFVFDIQTGGTYEFARELVNDLNRKSFILPETDLARGDKVVNVVTLEQMKMEHTCVHL